ncbi:preprotein translocase subunit SecG [Paracoccus sp. (in: a-proteobacteria)]|uniref:preprotein translocase subunit SecG n=1 Tax=Paracoccus sp. TaxID=267 RepID=UPI00396CBA33
MENVILTVHLILAAMLTGVVLLQRSEGGGLGMGGGGGGAGGVMSGRQAANALTRLTWILGVAIFCTSIGLTVLAARQASTGSVLDQLGVPAGNQSQTNVPTLPAYTPPPATGGNPLTPPAPDAPAGESPAAAAPVPQAPAAQAPEVQAPAADVTPPAVAPAPAAPAVPVEAAPEAEAIAPPAAVETPGPAEAGSDIQGGGQPAN